MSSSSQPVVRKMPVSRAVLSTEPETGIDLAAHGSPHRGSRRLESRHSLTAEGQTTLPRPSPVQAVEHSLAAVNVKKSYKRGGVAIPVLKRVSLGVRRGEFLAVAGQSGSGKSTLLHLLGTLDTPDDGAIYFDGARIDNLSSKYRDTLRNKYFGMIFQMYHLLPELSTLENVLAPMMIGQSVWQFFRDRRKHREVARLRATGVSPRSTRP
jgi:lipoprotein-releasing system ATP-binding protein